MFKINNTIIICKYIELFYCSLVELCARYNSYLFTVWFLKVFLKEYGVLKIFIVVY